MKLVVLLGCSKVYSFKLKSFQFIERGPVRCDRMSILDRTQTYWRYKKSKDYLCTLTVNLHVFCSSSRWKMSRTVLSDFCNFHPNIIHSNSNTTPYTFVRMWVHPFNTIPHNLLMSLLILLPSYFFPSIPFMFLCTLTPPGNLLLILKLSIFYFLTVRSTSLVKLVSVTPTLWVPQMSLVVL